MKSDKQKPDGNEKDAEEVLFFEPEGTDFGPKEQLDFACAVVRALKLKPNLRNMADRTPGRLAETKPFCRTLELFFVYCTQTLGMSPQDLETAAGGKSSRDKTSKEAYKALLRAGQTYLKERYADLSAQADCAGRTEEIRTRVIQPFLSQARQRNFLFGLVPPGLYQKYWNVRMDPDSKELFLLLLLRDKPDLFYSRVKPHLHLKKVYRDIWLRANREDPTEWLFRNSEWEGFAPDEAFEEATKTLFLQTVDQARLIDLFIKLTRAPKKAAAVLDRVEKEKNLNSRILEKIPEKVIDLYPHARSIRRHFVLHLGPTNSGKTHDAIGALGRAESGLYLGPLRLLAYEQFAYLNDQCCPCSLRTGEEYREVPGARHQASTVEMFNPTQYYDVVVIDEAQMLEDQSRGAGWTAAVLGAYSPLIHVCAAPAARDKLVFMIEACGDTYEIVEHERLVPLELEEEIVHFPREIRQGDACVVFSKRDLYAAKEALAKYQRASLIYGDLPYDVRENEARRFQSGETQIIIATDAIGMGLNLPIRRIVFLTSEKYDGVTQRDLRVEEVKQISGRAGRFGQYPVGRVACISADDLMVVKNAFWGHERPVESAYVDFPTILLDLPASLSDLLRRWDEIPVEEGFTRVRKERELKLCEMLEQKSGDKELIYRFICMPFDERSQSLFALWMFLFDCERTGEKVTLGKVRNIFGGTMRAEGGVSELEVSHKMFDLYGYYCLHFSHEEEMEEIALWRGRISTRLIELLKTGRAGLKGRRTERRPRR
ncbi:MAG: hypothetical protein IJU20_02850 [Clostridia bacterium]|nr:hypothetical protein [Clostridia bacterium]